MAEPALEDVEIVAELFKISRSGMFRTTQALLEQAQKQFPSESPERLRECSRQLAELLWDTNHGGYNDEYRRQRRKPAASKSQPASKE